MEANVKGIQFVVDDTGKKKAVIIDLEEWGELWEDISDIFVSESRRGESTVSWETLRAGTVKEQTQNGDV
jgi:hypothetical protein